MSKPNYKTPGRVGSIHVDVETGKRYICSSVYSNSNGVKEYTWKETVDVVKETEEDELKPSPEPQTPIEEPEEVQVEPEGSNKPRNYYSKQYNKNHNNYNR